MISFKNVSVEFKQKGQIVKAVNNVSLDINKGEFFGIVGTSGAGKSTLVRTINLLQKQTSGNVLVNGVDTLSLNNKELLKHRLNIGMIFQHFNLIKNATVFDNVAFALKASNFNKKDIESRVYEYLEQVSLKDYAKRYPSELSGGQKQRVAIARALVNKAKILLCDEATSALDPNTTFEIVDLLKELKTQNDLTLVFITHQMEVAKRLFDKVAVMKNGEVVECNNTYDLFANPKHEATKNLVNSVFHNDLPEEISKTQNLYTLTYTGDKAYEPLISSVTRKFNVVISILSGHIEYINKKAIGVLTVSFTGSNEDIQKALAYIKTFVAINEVGEHHA